MRRGITKQLGGLFLGGAQLWAFGASLVLFVAGAVFGYLTLSESWALGTVHLPGAPAQPEVSFTIIVLRNLAAVAFVYSGAATLGVATIVGLGLLSFFVGATAKVGVVAGGWGALIGDTSSYALIEFLGMVIAGAAGLYPLVATLVPGPKARAKGALGRYVDGLVGSVKYLLVSVVTIVLAAAIEALVIGSR